MNEPCNYAARKNFALILREEIPFLRLARQLKFVKILHIHAYYARRTVRSWLNTRRLTMESRCNAKVPLLENDHKHDWLA